MILDKNYRTMKLIGNELDKIGDEIYNLAQILEDSESKRFLRLSSYILMLLKIKLMIWRSKNVSENTNAVQS